MRKVKLFAPVFALLLSLSPAALAERYNVDPAHSTLSFSVSHFGLTEIDGRFNEFTGVIDWDHSGDDIAYIYGRCGVVKYMSYIKRAGNVWYI